MWTFLSEQTEKLSLFLTAPAFKRDKALAYNDLRLGRRTEVYWIVSF